MAENNVGHNSQINIPWSPLQQLHRNSLTSTATQRIQDFQEYVVQGLSQGWSQSLISPLRSTNNNSHSHRVRSRNNMDFFSHHHHHHHHYEHPHHAAISVEPDHFVIDINSQEPTVETAEQVSNAENLSENLPEQPASNARHFPENASDIELLRNSHEFQILMPFVDRYIPFVLILFLKLLFDHKLGIIVIMGLFITFFHGNIVLKREVSRQGKLQYLNLLWVCVNQITCIVVVYTLLADKELAFALIFVAPYSTPICVWDVLWVVSITDFIIRMLTILIKLCFVALPPKLIAFHKKGKYYLFVERTSQLYRTIAPMQHWLYFFSESYSGPSKIFGVILSAAYLIFKCKRILYGAKMWKSTFMKVLQSKTYGVTPSVTEIKEAGESCPICQDDYKSPSMLQCKHIFCEDCVALWFDRERTCPICRAQIADDPAWKDGATSLAIQIF